MVTVPPVDIRAILHEVVGKHPAATSEQLLQFLRAYPGWLLLMHQVITTGTVAEDQFAKAQQESGLGPKEMFSQLMLLTHFFTADEAEAQPSTEPARTAATRSPQQTKTTKQQDTGGTPPVKRTRGKRTSFPALERKKAVIVAAHKRDGETPVATLARVFGPQPSYKAMTAKLASALGQAGLPRLSMQEYGAIIRQTAENAPAPDVRKGASRPTWRDRIMELAAFNGHNRSMDAARTMVQGMSTGSFSDFMGKLNDGCRDAGITQFTGEEAQAVHTEFIRT